MSPYAAFCAPRSRALKDAGEQWSDAARQDLVSTLMIQAARDGAVSWVPLTREVN
jgi:hypothetical protein